MAKKKTYEEIKGTWLIDPQIVQGWSCKAQIISETETLYGAVLCTTYWRRWCEQNGYCRDTSIRRTRGTRRRRFLRCRRVQLAAE